MALAAQNRSGGGSPRGILPAVVRSVSLGGILTFVQFFFAVVIGLYFWNLLRSQQSGRTAVQRESRKEIERLQRLREIALSEPLAEKTRPSRFEDIVGQAEGLRALRAALCGPNPQHVIIYGPPGVGKTAAARVVLEEAKGSPASPFAADAKFVEIDATTARFDERGIADPLIGSVHDPIYQGAGPLGMAGIPQPKAGAVTKAHGGVLFIDEIGELHPVQMCKLLKVLEDRKVFLESAYYSPEDTQIPHHIKDIFDNGLPADFRLVGATTRTPDEIPPAIRSRCLEVFFRPLLPDEVAVIARSAAAKIGFRIQDGAVGVIQRYATNGREAVNIVQITAGIAQGEGRSEIGTADAEWVVTSGQYAPRPERKVPARPQVGLCNGLAVVGGSLGVLIEVEAAVVRAAEPGHGQVVVTGVIDEEEMGGRGRTMRRKSMAKGSLENVITVLRRYLEEDPRDYDIHVNFPGGIPIDGPSAGVTMAAAIYSALTGIPVDNRVAMTGEISIRGLIRPVGGVAAKLEAARVAGACRVVIPAENWQEMHASLGGLTVVPAADFGEVLDQVLVHEAAAEPAIAAAAVAAAAAGVAAPGAASDGGAPDVDEGADGRRRGKVPAPAAAAGGMEVPAAPA
jgi:Lon-like ATP-dependent protease